MSIFEVIACLYYMRPADLPGISARVHFSPRHGWPGWEATYVQLGLGVADEGELLLGRSAEHLLDLADLVQVVLAREHGLVVDHLPKDAAHAPDVQCLAVPLEVHHDAHHGLICLHSPLH
jgi:hypothetical protein